MLPWEVGVVSEAEVSSIKLLPYISGVKDYWLGTQVRIRSCAGRKASRGLRRSPWQLLSRVGGSKIAEMLAPMTNILSETESSNGTYRELVNAPVVDDEVRSVVLCRTYAA